MLRITRRQGGLGEAFDRLVGDWIVDSALRGGSRSGSIGMLRARLGAAVQRSWVRSGISLACIGEVA